MFQVLHDSLLTDGLLDPLLSLDIVRVRIQTLNLPVCVSVALTGTAKKFCEAGGVVLCCCCDLGLRLRG